MSAACPPVALRAETTRCVCTFVQLSLDSKNGHARWSSQRSAKTQGARDDAPRAFGWSARVKRLRARSTPSAAPCSQQLPTHSRQHHSSWRHSHLLLATAKSGRGTTTSNYRRQRRPPPSLPLPLRLLPPALPPLRHQHALPYSRPRRLPRSRRCVSRCVTRASRRRRELPNAPAVSRPCFCTPSRRRSSPRARS